MYYTVSDLLIPASSIVTYQRRCINLEVKNILKAWKRSMEKNGFPLQVPVGGTVSDQLEIQTERFTKLLEHISSLPICRIKLIDGTHLDTLITQADVDTCLKGTPVHLEDFTLYMNREYGEAISGASCGVCKDFYSLATTIFTNPLL